MSDAASVQIRSPIVRFILLAVVCVLFVVVGVVLLISGSAGGKVVAVLTIVLFGGGTGWAIRRLARTDRVLMTLTPDGLEAHGDRIPWSEITSVGPTTVGRPQSGGRAWSGTFGSAKALGVRLRDLGGYVAGLPDERVEQVLRRATAAAALLDASPEVRSGAGPRSQLMTQLRSLREANGGYDLTWASSVLPSSAERVAQRIRSYAGGRLGRH